MESNAKNKQKKKGNQTTDNQTRVKMGNKNKK